MAKAKKMTPKRAPLSKMERVEMMQTGRKPKKRRSAGIPSTR